MGTKRGLSLYGNDTKWDVWEDETEEYLGLKGLEWKEPGEKMHKDELQNCTL
jgi:hypothetical protein